LCKKTRKRRGTKTRSKRREGSILCGENPLGNDYAKRALILSGFSNDILKKCMEMNLEPSIKLVFGKGLKKPAFDTKAGFLTF
jgi:hypothetical protein